MSRVVVAFAVSASASLLLTPLARWLAWRRGSLDRADGQRKLQPSPVPHLGGPAVFAALVTGAAVSFCGDGWAVQGSLPLALLASAALICLVGWCDDEFVLRVRWKLFGQVVATLPLVLTGQVLERVEFCGWVCDLGWWSLPIEHRGATMARRHGNPRCSRYSGSRLRVLPRAADSLIGD